MTLEYGQSCTRSISEVGLEVPVACESTLFGFMKAVLVFCSTERGQPRRIAHLGTYTAGGLLPQACVLWVVSSNFKRHFLL